MNEDLVCNIFTMAFNNRSSRSMSFPLYPYHCATLSGKNVKKGRCITFAFTRECYSCMSVLLRIEAVVMCGVCKGLSCLDSAGARLNALNPVCRY